MAVNIRLDDNRKNYSPGDTVQGTVTFKLFLTQRLHNFTVQIRGLEGVDWYYLTSGNTTSKQRYQTNVFLSKEERIEVEEKLQPGEHEIPFKITLPEDLPGTFRYPHCFVKFLLVADILQRTVQTEINVDSPLDLNLVAEETLLTPSWFTSKKNFSCLCWSSGIITTDIYMKRRALSKDEKPQIKVEVDNKSRRKIRRIKLTLKTVVEAVAAGYSAPDRKVKLHSKEMVARCTNGNTSVLSNTSRKMVFNLDYPNFPAVYNFTRCKLFRQMSYIEVRGSRCGSDLVVKIPVLLAHIPPKGQVDKLTRTSAFTDQRNLRNGSYTVEKARTRDSFDDYCGDYQDLYYNHLFLLNIAEDDSRNESSWFFNPDGSMFSPTTRQNCDPISVRQTDYYCFDYFTDRHYTPSYTDNHYSSNTDHHSSNIDHYSNTGHYSSNTGDHYSSNTNHHHSSSHADHHSGGGGFFSSMFGGDASTYVSDSIADTTISVAHDSGGGWGGDSGGCDSGGGGGDSGGGCDGGGCD